MLLLFVYCFAILCTFYTYGQSTFEVPDATVEVFTPSGLRVSIPDVDGIKLFAFHAKINEEMNGREGGTFSRDITKAKNGRWTFYDPQAKLKVGDTLYYWTYVDYFDGERRLGYPKDDQYFVVKELLPKPGPPPRPGSTGITTSKPSVPPRIPGGCDPSETIVRGENSCKGKLLFNSEETFGESKDQFWTHQRKFATGPDYEFVIYDPRMSTIQDGKLVITPNLTDSVYGEGFVTQEREGLDIGEKCTGVRASAECYQKAQAWMIIPPVISSQMTTKGKFSFKYGRIQVQAKLPKGDWLYPELFLNPESEEYGPYYESGQIRIAFAAGNKNDSLKLEGGIILGHSPAARKYGMRSVEQIQPWTDDFHDFIVLWTPDSITLSVDNVVYGTIFPPENGFSSLAPKLQLKNSERWNKGGKLAPFDKEMHIVVGVGAGGHNFEDRCDGSKPWSNYKPISQKDFYKARGLWYPTWGKDANLVVKSLKVWALD